jgi:hypothetical protein
MAEAKKKAAAQKAAEKAAAQKAADETAYSSIKEVQ